VVKDCMTCDLQQLQLWRLCGGGRDMQMDFGRRNKFQSYLSRLDQT
jgi:hypothetical protein